MKRINYNKISLDARILLRENLDEAGIDTSTLSTKELIKLNRIHYGKAYTNELVNETYVDPMPREIIINNKYNGNNWTSRVANQNYWMFHPAETWETIKQMILSTTILILILSTMIGVWTLLK